MTCPSCPTCADAAALATTRAAMCASCVGSSSRCIDGEPVLLHVRGMACPRGVHPAPATGIVRWRGAAWYGVPCPVRIGLAWRGFETDALPGCACMVRLKAIWTRYRLAEPPSCRTLARIALRLARWRPWGHKATAIRAG